MTLLFPIERIARSRSVAYSVIVIVTCLVILAVFLENGEQLLPASTLAYASCFLLTIYFLRNRMTSLFDILLTSAGTTFSGLWLYEVFYHYYLGTTIDGLKYDFSHFSIVLYPGWAFPVYFAAILILIPFLKKQYISLNVPLMSIFALSVAIFAIWSGIGHSDNFGRPGPVTVVYWMSSVSEILAVVPAFLFCEKGKIIQRRS